MEVFDWFLIGILSAPIIALVFIITLVFISFIAGRTYQHKKERNKRRYYEQFHGKLLH